MMNISSAEAGHLLHSTLGEELLRAARWARTHDPSPGFDEVLRRVLAHYGVNDGDL